MWTPDAITITEALITFGMFPVLVFMAYAQSKGWWLRKPAEAAQNGDDPESAEPRRASFQIFTEAQVVGMKRSSFVADRSQIAKMLKEKSKDHSPEDIKREIMKSIDETEEHDPGHDYMMYRINAARQLGGRVHRSSRNTNTQSNSKQVYPDEMQTADDHGDHLEETDIEKSIQKFRGGTKPVIGLSARSYSVIESADYISVKVVRGGLDDHAVTVDYETEDGSAKDGEDYTAVRGTLSFQPQETVKRIKVPIIDDNQYEPDESFKLKLTNASEQGVIIVSECEITIIDDDDPGQVGFERRAIEVNEIDENCPINIVRKNGSDGTITVDFETADDTAIAGEDYYATSGTITFEHGEVLKTINIPLINDTVPETGASPAPGGAAGRPDAAPDSTDEIPRARAPARPGRQMLRGRPQEPHRRLHHLEAVAGDRHGD